MHDRDDRHAGGGKARHIGENRAAAHEHFGLQQQIGAGALDKLHERQFVLQRDLLRANGFLDAHRMGGAALDAGIIGGDDAARAGNHADADDRAAAENIVLAVVLVHAEAAQRRKLKERRIAIEQQVDAFARRQLTALAKFRVRPARSLTHLFLKRAKFGDQRKMRGAIGLERLAVDDDVRANCRQSDASLLLSGS